MAPNPIATLLAALASGAWVSSGFLVRTIGIDRAGVLQHVQALRQAGVPVQVESDDRWRLPWPIQLLDGSRITGLLARGPGGSPALDVIWEIDSTSSELLRRGAAAADLTFVLAETQSAGRGRRGRAWLSPPGLNLYLSVLKRFDGGFATLSGLSLAVGVMVLRALRALGIEGAGLKWPNDIVTDEGKLGGILVELAGDALGPCSAVIGIGLNLRLPPALRAQAGQPASDLASLARSSVLPDRNRVAAVLIDVLVQGLHEFQRRGFAAFADDYARHDCLIEQPLTVSGGQGAFDGTGAGVDARGALRVRLADGDVRTVDSADVTVRRA